MAKLPLLGDASPWLHDAVSQFMATFSGEDVSFVMLVRLLVELDRRVREEDDKAAAELLKTVKHFHRLIQVAQKP